MKISVKDMTIFMNWEKRDDDARMTKDANPRLAVKTSLPSYVRFGGSREPLLTSSEPRSKLM